MFFEPEREVSETTHKLPHWQQDNAWIFVTYRLADSLPKPLLSELKERREAWLHHNPKPWNQRQETEHHQLFSSKFDEWLDAGHGSCCLREKQNALIVTKAFHHFDNERYLIDSFVVMPNHVHILFSPLSEHQLSDIIHSWKRFTAREINKHRNQTGQFWQPEYWDRLIRHQEHFYWAQNYIKRNPKKLPNDQYQLYLKP